MNSNTTEPYPSKETAKSSNISDESYDGFSFDTAYKLVDDLLFNCDSQSKTAFCELLKQIASNDEFAAHRAKFICRYAFFNYSPEFELLFEKYIDRKCEDTKSEADKDKEEQKKLPQGLLQTRQLPQPLQLTSQQRPKTRKQITKVVPPLEENQKLYGITENGDVQELRPLHRDKPFILPKQFHDYLLAYEFGGEQ